MATDLAPQQPAAKAYPDDFYLNLQSTQKRYDRNRIINHREPPPVDGRSRNHIFAPEIAWGSTGAGKTMLALCRTLMHYDFRSPLNGINRGFKVIAIDRVKCELACAFEPMPPTHSLYPLLMSLGRKPRSYPVEVYRPALMFKMQPDLQIMQPDIVKPFTLALSSLSTVDWISIIGEGLSPNQLKLHKAALRELRKHGHIEEATMQDLYVAAQTLQEQGNIGISPEMPGMDDLPVIKVTQKGYGGREAGLLDKYEEIMNTGLIMPAKFEGKLVASNLNIRKILLNRDVISIFYLNENREFPSLSYGIMCYILSQLFYLKQKVSPEHVDTPVCLFTPELRDIAPKSIPEEKRYYMDKVRAAYENLVSQGHGMGIKLIADSQYPKQITDTVKSNMQDVALFDLGMDARDTIREVLGNRFVMNIKESTFPRYLNSLKKTGTFLWVGYSQLRAEFSENGIVDFHYPRDRQGISQTETSYEEIFERVHHDRMVSIQPVYDRIQAVYSEGQVAAAKTMTEALKVKRQRKEQEKAGKGEQTMIMSMQELDKICKEKQTNLLPYTELVGELVFKCKFSEPWAREMLKKGQLAGVLRLDYEGTKKPKSVNVKLKALEEFLVKAANGVVERIPTSPEEEAKEALAAPPAVPEGGRLMESLMYGGNCVVCNAYLQAKTPGMWKRGVGIWCVKHTVPQEFVGVKDTEPVSSVPTP